MPLLKDGACSGHVIDMNKLYGPSQVMLWEKPMAVRAKVRCNAKTDQEVHFTTVYEQPGSKNDENIRFTEATPWGDIRLGINNPAALAQFEVNKEYYIDFTPAGG